MSEILTVSIYAVPVLLIYMLYLRKHQDTSTTNVAVLDESINAGMTEPASLHPLIDQSKCIGCGSCVAACPEQPGHQVLGLINKKAHLISPTDCIGHGACKTACPRDAITLVFGTEKRGVDIPVVKTNFETNVPGIYIAGELGGMGLIKNAITQGCQAVKFIKKEQKPANGKYDADLIIIGAGPAGFAATLQAMAEKLKTITIEQESLGGTVFQFPRGKLVMTAPVELPLVGKIKFTETSKEKLLDFWGKVEKKTGMNINYNESVKEILRKGDGFEVVTSKGSYSSRAVLLSIGRRGTPRKLGVPGEHLPKVVYRLIDPEQYQHKNVLIVGGGDSALEAATSIAAEPGTNVILSYRSEAFTRAKEKNRKKVEQAVADGSLTVHMKSNLKEVHENHVHLETADGMLSIENDAVIINAGGILPTGFLKSIGIEVETKYGTA